MENLDFFKFLEFPEKSWNFWMAKGKVMEIRAKYHEKVMEFDKWVPPILQIGATFLIPSIM